MKDWKYLLAYLVPASAMLSLAWQGAWAWSTPLLAFCIVPVLELFVPQSKRNGPEEEDAHRAGRRFFDWLLYLNAPLVFGIVGWYLWIAALHTPPAFELLGLTIATGVVASTCGINVAHELGHRSLRTEQLLAQIMLLPSLYQHFFVEHNRGHHKNVATDADPASARLGENMFAFWLRSVAGSWRDAWAIEAERLQKEGKQITTWQNLMLRYTVFQSLWLAVIFLLLGWKGLLAAFAVAVISFLLLESVNYIEHYGLRRAMLPSGRPEPVLPRHSWNSNHELGRILLYELTRHSDHHYKSTRKYQVLRHLDESPQLPFGYPTSIVIAFFPPLWFKVMNRRVV